MHKLITYPSTHSRFTWLLKMLCQNPSGNDEFCRAWAILPAINFLCSKLCFGLFGLAVCWAHTKSAPLDRWWPGCACTLKKKVLVAQSCLTLCDPMDCSPARLLCPWDFPGKNNGVGSPSLLQGIFLTQESNPGLLNCMYTNVR